MKLTESLHEVYEPDWYGREDVKMVGEVRARIAVQGSLGWGWSGSAKLHLVLLTPPVPWCPCYHFTALIMSRHLVCGRQENNPVVWIIPNS